MVDSVRVLDPGWRALDVDGVTLPGATLEFYQAGTDNSLTVYSDADLSTAIGAIITCDAGGYPTASAVRTLIYTGTAAYKIVCKNASGAEEWTHDDISGALDTSGYASDTSTPVTLVTNTASNITLDVATHQARLININCSGADRIATLPSAIDAGNGWRVGIRHNGTANFVSIRTTGGQIIDGVGYEDGTAALRGLGETLWLVADGARWNVDTHVPAFMTGEIPTFVVQGRNTAPPTSPRAGQRWIVEGTPTGTWSSYSEHDVLEYDGLSDWIVYTPPSDCGWIAYVKDENTTYQHTQNSWVAWQNVEAPDPDDIGVLIVEDRKTSGTGGGTPTTTTWTTRTLNTTVKNDIAGASRSASTITLPGDADNPKSYLVTATSEYSSTGFTKTRFRATDDSINIYSTNISFASGVGGKSILHGTVTLTEDTDFDLQYYVAAAGNLGFAQSLSGIDEVYTNITIIALESLRGPAGINGVDGATGPAGTDAGLTYEYNAATSGDPGAGKFRFDNATILSATEIALSDTDINTADMSAALATWDDAVAPVFGTLVIVDDDSPSNIAVVDITSATDNTTYWTFGITPLVSNGTFAGNCQIQFARSGSTGPTGPNTGLDYAWDTSTSGDPGSGRVAVNNASLASATVINISKTGRNSESLGSVIEKWDDSSNDTYRGHIRIFTVADRTEFLEAELSGTITDNSTYFSIPITVEASNGTPSTSDIMAVMFERSGNKGTAALDVRAATTSDTITEAETVLFENASTATATLASGLTKCIVTRTSTSAADVTIISADAPTVTVAGDATGVVLNSANTAAIITTDPNDSNNYVLTALSASGGAGNGQPWYGTLTVSEISALSSPVTGGQAFATDGRKTGEGVGSGTGVEAFYDGSGWVSVQGGTLAA